jgi:membrane peptidoglycan carboxypeptidase
MTKKILLRWFYSAIVFLVCIAIGSVANFYFLAESKHFIEAADLTARPLKGAIIMTASRTLVIGQKFSPKEFINYLKTVGFCEATKTHTLGDLPIGCFLINAENRQLHLRSLVDDHLYPPLIIRWSKNDEIVRLVSGGNEVNSAEVEGYSFNNRIYSLEQEQAETVLKNFVVIRIPTRWQSLQGKPIYYVAQAAEGSFNLPISPLNLLGSVNRNYIKPLFGYKTGNLTGGSTPTMQLCRNAILYDERDSFIRKIREMYCASTLSTQLSEPEIVEAYFNHVYYGFWRGEHLYGVETAAQKIFGKSAVNLNLVESAWLCALAPTPIRLKKLAAGDEKNLALHQARVETILNRLLERYPDKFTPRQIEEAKGKSVKFSDVKNVSPQTRLDRMAKPFIQMVVQEFPPLKERIDPKTSDVSASQLSDTVYQTRLEPEIMFAAQRILQTQLKKIRASFPPINEKYKSVADDLVGVVSLTDPKTGEVIALVVATTNSEREISAIYANNLIDPASQKKVFDIALSLEKGLLTPITRINPAEGRIIEKCNGKLWKPETGVGEEKTVAEILSSSDDGGITKIVGDSLGLEESVGFFEKITENQVKTFENKTGCKQYAPLNAIGFGVGIKPLQFNELFSMFSTEGNKYKNRFLSNIHFNGKFTSSASLPIAQPKPIISPQTSFQMMWMMRKVITEGTAANLPFSDYVRKHPQFAIGCKSGSGNLAVGFSCVTPRFTFSTQIFYAKGSRFRQTEKNKIFSANTAGKVWSDLMFEILKIKPKLFQGEIPRPDGIVEVKVDLARSCQSDSGVLVPFKSGTEPEPCDWTNESEPLNTQQRTFIVQTRNQQGVNLRESKSLDSPSLKFVPEGSQITVLSCETEQVFVNGRLGSWCRVEYEGMEGWVWGWTLKESPPQ